MHIDTIILAFAKQGVSIETMALALDVPRSQVRSLCEMAFRFGKLSAMPPETNEPISRVVTPDGETDLSRWAGTFTAMEAKIVDALVTHGRRSKEQLFAALYDGATSAPDPRILDVYVYNLRKKLPPGVTIDTLWGFGYVMTPTSRDALCRYVEPAGPSLVPDMRDMVA